MLGEDAGNVKALFRKGQGLMNTAAYREAKAALKEAYKLDPKNKQVISLLKKVDAQAKKDKAEEKKRLAKMMGGMIGAPAAVPSPFTRR